MFYETGGQFTNYIFHCLTRNRHPGFRQTADPLPKICVWCRRDVIFREKRAFGVDETTLDFQNVHLVQTRRSLESAVCRKSMFYVDETLVEGCSCEAKSNAPRILNVSQIGSQKNRRLV